ADRRRVRRPGRAGARAEAARPGAVRRDLLDLEPRHVRRRRVLGHHQPARGRDPRGRLGPAGAGGGRGGPGGRPAHGADDLVRSPGDGRRDGRPVPAGRQAPARGAAPAPRLAMASHKFDVAIVGTGPGGYVAAIRCAQLGLTVGVVEDDRPGGVCLNWGCIPTKALLRNAEVVSLFGRAAEFGVSVTGFQADYAAAVQRSRRVADRMAKGVEFLFRKNKITLFPGRATLKAAGTVEVAAADGARTTLQAKAVVLGTGSEPRSLPGVTIDESRVMSSNGAVRN